MPLSQPEVPDFPRLGRLGWFRHMGGGRGGGGKGAWGRWRRWGCGCRSSSAWSPTCGSWPRGGTAPSAPSSASTPFPRGSRPPDRHSGVPSGQGSVGHRPFTDGEPFGTFRSGQVFLQVGISVLFVTAIFHGGFLGHCGSFRRPSNHCSHYYRRVIARGCNSMAMQASQPTPDVPDCSGLTNDVVVYGWSDGGISILLSNL